MRRSLAPVALALAAVTAGCGSASSEPTTVGPGTQALTTPAGTAASPAAATTAASAAPDGTFGFVFTTGDHVEVSYSIAAPISLAAAGPLAQSCESQLQNDPSRALVYRISVASKITTAMGGKFTLEFGQQRFPMAVQYGNDVQRCWGLGEPGDVTLTLAPGNTVHSELWLVADGVKTPDAPNGDPELLREVQFTPTMYVGTNTFGLKAGIDYAFGPRVWVCNAGYASTLSATVYADAGSYADAYSPGAGPGACRQAGTRAAFDDDVAEAKR